MIEGRQRGGCTGAHGDDDLLVGHGGAIAGSEDAGHGGLALGVDFDFAELAQVDRAFQPVGVGQQADLHEDAFQFDVLFFARSAGPCRSGR
jgi:hypothetical protein